MARSAAVLLSASSLTIIACDTGMPARVTGWAVLDNRTLEVTVEFDSHAPRFGCEVDAWDDAEKSLGYVIAKPDGRTEATFEMRLDRGTSDQVDEVAVADCGT